MGIENVTVTGKPSSHSDTTLIPDTTCILTHIQVYPCFVNCINNQQFWRFVLNVIYLS